jgi:hypothetical protein
MVLLDGMADSELVFSEDCGTQKFMTRRRRTTVNISGQHCYLIIKIGRTQPRWSSFPDKGLGVVWVLGSFHSIIVVTRSLSLIPLAVPYQTSVNEIAWVLPDLGNQQLSMTPSNYWYLDTPVDGVLIAECGDGIARSVNVDALLIWGLSELF